jgi:hypothetical protein
MNDSRRAGRDRDALLDDFAAELTRAAYSVALRHRAAGTWLDLELDLWRALADTVKQWGRESPPVAEAAFACDWAAGPSEAALPRR